MEVEVLKRVQFEVELGVASEGGTICATFVEVCTPSFNRVCLLLSDRRSRLRSLSNSRAIEFNSANSLLVSAKFSLSEEPDGSLLLVSILSIQQSTKL